MPTYTLEEIRQAQVTASQLSLYGSHEFCLTPAEKLQRICNGIGPSWMPDVARNILDARFLLLKVIAMIHDTQYYFGTGTDADFHNANHNLYDNACIIAKANYGWYSPVRYMVMWDGWKMYKACDDLGRSAYKAAIAERERDEARESESK